MANVNFVNPSSTGKFIQVKGQTGGIAYPPQTGQFINAPGATSYVPTDFIFVKGASNVP